MRPFHAVATLFSLSLLLSGCGLIPLSITNGEEIENPSPTQPEPKGESKLSNQTDEPSIKEEKGTPYIEKKDPEITPENDREQGLAKPSKEVPADSLKPVTPKENNPPIEEPRPQPETPEPEPEVDEKLEEAKRIAKEVTQTQQTIRSEDGKVYREASASSEVIQRVKREQKLFVKETKVNPENYTIWCRIQGEITQEQEGEEPTVHTFEGWVSYQIINPEYRP